ncbi:MAG: YggT family protein [Deltaproteobacteria bacterium]|nr:YggT family protein [Deltaproteobacteria bacterium]
MESLFHFLAGAVFWFLLIYEWILIIAILITWVNADPASPLVRFLNRMSRPFWNFLQRILPARLAPFAAYASLLVVWFGQIFFPGLLDTLGDTLGGTLDLSTGETRIGGFFLLGLGVVFKNLLSFLTLMLVVWFILTMARPSPFNPVVRSLGMLVDPFITPFQKRLPRMSVDISPLLAALVFFLINLYLVGSLVMYGKRLSLAYPYTNPMYFQSPDQTFPSQPSQDQDPQDGEPREQSPSTRP